MKLPADCPYVVILLEADLEPDRGRPCRRAHCPFRSLGDSEVPLCLSWGTEVYRLTWDSSFDGDAVVRIARPAMRPGSLASIVLRVSFVPNAARRPDCCDWARLQDALIAANFWAFNTHGEAYGLDGACWTIEGRRKDIFRAVRRWSPDDQLHDLGRLLFDLAGLHEVRIY